MRPSAHAKFDLTVAVVIRREGIEVRADYCADLFLPETVQRMLRQYARLIEGMAREPDRPVSQLPLMDDETEACIRDAARLATPGAVSDGTIHRRFAGRAAMQPAQRATESLTYGDLDAAANRRLASSVRWAWVVAPLLPSRVLRHRNIAIAWLATLKAGAAYLPIDPGLPGRPNHVHAARCARRTRDCRCRRRKPPGDRWGACRLSRARCRPHRRARFRPGARPGRTG
jgi:non-ribosomal peptide synthetase component F